MFIPERYKLAPPLDTGIPRLAFTAENLPYVSFGGQTGYDVQATLGPGTRGYVQVFNAAIGGLPGNVVPGMFTQPLSLRGQP